MCNTDSWAKCVEKIKNDFGKLIFAKGNFPFFKMICNFAMKNKSICYLVFSLLHILIFAVDT